MVNSTLCAADSPNYVAGSAGVSEADKQLIIDRHNLHRAAVSPTATNMMKVVSTSCQLEENGNYVTYC